MTGSNAASSVVPRLRRHGASAWEEVEHRSASSAVARSGDSPSNSIPRTSQATLSSTWPQSLRPTTLMRSASRATLISPGVSPRRRSFVGGPGRPQRRARNAVSEDRSTSNPTRLSAPARSAVRTDEANGAWAPTVFVEGEQLTDIHREGIYFSLSPLVRAICRSKRRTADRRALYREAYSPRESVTYCLRTKGSPELIRALGSR